MLYPSLSVHSDSLWVQCWRCVMCDLIICEFLPERSCQHALSVHYLSCGGMYTSPSCHRWSALFLSSPGRTDRRKINMKKTWAANVIKRKKTGSDWLVYLSGDAAVLVDIIQIKGPVEFISDGASQDDGQTYNKVLQQGKKTGTKSEDHNKDKKGTDKTFQYLLHWYYVLCFFSSNPVILTPTEFHQQSEIILKSNEIYTRCAPRTKLYAAFFQTLRKSIIKLHSIDKEKDSKEDEKGKGKTSLWAAGNERRLWGVYLTSKLTEPLFCVSKASNKKCAYILESAKENIRKQVTVTVQQSRQWFCVMTA